MCSLQVLRDCYMIRKPCRGLNIDLENKMMEKRQTWAGKIEVQDEINVIMKDDNPLNPRPFQKANIGLDYKAKSFSVVEMNRRKIGYGERADDEIHVHVYIHFKKVYTYTK